MKFKIVLSLLAMAFLFTAGCNKLACERYAQCLEEETGYEMSDDDIDECVDELKDEEAACRAAFRKLMRCLDKEGCDGSGCEDEAEEASDDC